MLVLFSQSRCMLVCVAPQQGQVMLYADIVRLRHIPVSDRLQCGELQLYPGGRCTTTAKVSGDSATGDMGIVSTHRVKEPHRCTCNGRLSRCNTYASSNIPAADARGDMAHVMLSAPQAP